MTDTNVQAADLGGYCAPIAAELHRIADAFADAAHHELPEPRLVHLHIQPGGRTDDEIVNAVDALGLALGGKTGVAERMTSDGIYHYQVEVQRGPIQFQVYRQIGMARAVQISAVARTEVIGTKEAEIARLRAEVAGLRAAAALTPDADPAGLRVPAEDATLTPGAPAESGLVTVYFSFGHGQTDPDTGEDLLDHYVTIVGPSYEACREAMFASRYGAHWSFDYVAGTPMADEWIPRWTEHERIDLTAGRS